MSTSKYLFITLFTSILLQISLANANEMDHHAAHNSNMNHGDIQTAVKDFEKSNALDTLQRIPSSGKAREAGFDQRYTMESLMLEDSIQEKCAKASRGLIMLDNASWAKCTTKPAGLARSEVVNKPAMSHHNHDSM